MEITVLLTGASSGIGYSMANLLAGKGYHLVLVARREDRLLELGGNLSQTYGIQVDTIVKDLSQPNAPEEVFQELREKGIDIDILINNAGTQVYGEFHLAGYEETMRLIHVNITALTKLTKLAIEDMLANGRKGKIMNLGSTGSFAPSALNAVYCATKAYVLSFSEGIAKDLEGTGITVTAVCPGATRSEFAEKSNLLGARMFNFGVMEADDVAKIGYKAMMKNKRVVVVGLINRLMVASIPFTPRSLLLAISRYLMDTPVRSDRMGQWLNKNAACRSEGSYT